MGTVSSRLTLAGMLLFTGGVRAQIPSAAGGPVAMRVDVNLVMVPVTVTDRHGRIVTGLEQSRFTVFEEGRPQFIASLSTESLPASIGLVLDVSGSMKQKLAIARSFIRSLLAAT